LRKRSLFAVFLTIFLDLVGFGMFIPVIVTIAADFGASPAEAASINTWHSIGTLASVIVLGRLSDRFGRKPVLIATVALSAVTQLMTGYAGSLMALVVLRFLAGAAAGNISVAQACISDLTDPRKRASAMAIIGIAFGGGFAIGPALGALISRWAGDDLLLAIGWTSFLLNAVNLVFVSRMLVETHPGLTPSPERTAHANTSTGANPAPFTAARSIFGDFAGLFGSRPLRILFLMQFIQVFGFVGLETILPIVLKDAYGFSKSQTYDAFVVMGLAVLLFNGLVVRRLLGKLDERHAIKAGQLLLCIGIAAVHLAAPLPMGLYGALIVIACGTAFTNPAVSSLTSKLCQPEQLGMTFGALQLVATSARILGPLFMGGVYEFTAGSKSLWFTVGLIGLASATAWLLPKTKKQETPI
jgi:MFS family permease